MSRPSYLLQLNVVYIYCRSSDIIILAHVIVALSLISACRNLRSRFEKGRDPQSCVAQLRLFRSNFFFSRYARSTLTSVHPSTHGLRTYIQEFHNTS